MKKSLLVIGSIMFVATSAVAADWDKDVLPLVDKHCASCHSSDKAEYAGWDKSGALQKHLDDGANVGGSAGSMHEYLGETDQERAKNLAVFKAWLGGDAAWKAKIGK